MVSEWAADEVAEIIHSDRVVSVDVKKRSAAIVRCRTRNVDERVGRRASLSCSSSVSHPAPQSPTAIQIPQPHPHMTSLD